MSEEEEANARAWALAQDTFERLWAARAERQDVSFRRVARQIEAVSAYHRFYAQTMPNLLAPGFDRLSEADKRHMGNGLMGMGTSPIAPLNPDEAEPA